MKLTKEARRVRIKHGIRKKVFGSSERPRLSVYRSNKEIYAQIIDDNSGRTLAAASSRDKGFETTGPKVDISKAVGQLLAKRASDAGVVQVVFDRNGYLYHGRVKALAEGAREGGLNF
jgi:large subunit ribosomal protein L18